MNTELCTKIVSVYWMVFKYDSPNMEMVEICKIAILQNVLIRCFPDDVMNMIEFQQGLLISDNISFPILETKYTRVLSVYSIE